MCSRRLALAGSLAALLTACATAAPGFPPHGAGLPSTLATLDATPATPPSAMPAPVAAPSALASALASRIGANDLLEITILEAPEMNRSVRVSADGGITLPLLGEVRAAGQTPRELEVALETRLRERYIREPHVSVQVTEMQSHGVAVVGAVARPGVFQVREPRMLLDLVALAGGFSERAGKSVVVVRGGAGSVATPPGTPAGSGPGGTAAADSSVEVSIRELLDTGDPRHNVVVQPGDLVKVTFAGVVYVVGEVRRPGAFPLERGARLSVLQAVALGEGLGPRAARSRALIIRTTETGQRYEIPVDLGDVLAGRAVDPTVQERDVVFVPNSTVRTVTLGTIDALLRMVTFRAVF